MPAKRAVRKPQTVKVGECPCGLPIMVADRYSVSLTGPTTIKRKCQGYRCGRTNEIILSAPRYTVERATWKVLDCRCGAGIYLRSDYAGKGFPGWDRKGKTAFDLMVEHKGDYKNRTIKAECPRCECVYKFVIRFAPGKNDKGEAVTRRDYLTGSKVTRGKCCQHRAEAS